MTPTFHELAGGAARYAGAVGIARAFSVSRDGIGVCGVPLTAVENALMLAAARRSAKPAGAPPLATIRSPAYFAPVIEEVLQLEVGPEYFQHLRNRLQRATPAQ